MPGMQRKIWAHGAAAWSDIFFWCVTEGAMKAASRAMCVGQKWGVQLDWDATRKLVIFRWKILGKNKATFLHTWLCFLLPSRECVCWCEILIWRIVVSLISHLEMCYFGVKFLQPFFFFFFHPSVYHLLISACFWQRTCPSLFTTHAQKKKKKRLLSCLK